ncbi:amidase [Mesorhizobium sp. M3A.F.Ca.ET.174.01.1.1]|uniref:amidase n=1 Tax=unclassified Mesorhizobium TaxID=325217 RepID=UPI0010937385|nr:MULTISPECIES: amidase [unclassified Mesorhizobium]TGS85025.1 amidase [Mesorhizobium sp. M3A.F.Ca.ET.175.01.1.1]TGT21725.1 amidase [Mesorhizobium sp. M3A.F.Ca.ET.174.01.1.1]
MTLSDIHYQPMTKVADAIKSGAVSPVEVTNAILSRIEAVDPGLKSYTTVTAELALFQAKRAEDEISKGQYRGPMHGIPVAVKDLCFTKGIKTTGGMIIYEDHRPDYDATVVKKLDEAGAVLLGKLHMTEGATMEHHPEMPEPVNPWKVDLWTGASSSGSGIAPAAGLAYASIGSDTGGSIRFPSACNGLTGVKPTWGLISRYGIFDLAATFDHLGPIARSAADAAAMLEALAGYDPNDPTSLSTPVPGYLAALDGVYGARGIKIGVDWDFISEDADPVTVGFVKDAVEVLTEIRAVPLPIKFPEIDTLLKYTMALCRVEMAAAHEATYPSQANRYGEWIRNGLEQGLTVTPIQLGKGFIERQKYRGKMRKLFEDIDLVVIPVFRKGTPTWKEVRDTMANDMNALMRFTSPFNATGNPTVTLPCGYTDDSRPVAFQLVGPHGSEAILLKVAHAYQQVTDYHTRRPAGY